MLSIEKLVSLNGVKHKAQQDQVYEWYNDHLELEVDTLLVCVDKHIAFSFLKII